MYHILFHILIVIVELWCQSKTMWLRDGQGV